MMLHRTMQALGKGARRSISTTSARFLDVPSSKPLTEERQREMDESKRSLEWRAKPFERKNAWYSKFKLLMSEDNEAARESIAVKLQQPIDMRPSALKKLFKFNREKQERFLQQFVDDRHRILGNDLAAAHFLVFRGAGVRFFGQKGWLKAEKGADPNLPKTYQPDVFVEAIDCEGVEIYYEGLENLRRLKYLRFLSYKDVESFDDWCLDRLSGSEYESLEILNLSGTKISHRGLQALYRVPTLKKLILSDPYRDVQWKLTLAMLQDILPDLEIIETKVATEKP